MPKNAKFICELCDFKCCKRSNYDIHITTVKHLSNVEKDKNDKKDNKKMPYHNNFICEICNSYYKYQSGLSRHKKECVNNKNINDNNNPRPKPIKYILLLSFAILVYISFCNGVKIRRKSCIAFILSDPYIVNIIATINTIATIQLDKHTMSVTLYNILLYKMSYKI